MMYNTEPHEEYAEHADVETDRTEYKPSHSPALHPLITIDGEAYRK